MVPSRKHGRKAAVLPVLCQRPNRRPAPQVHYACVTEITERYRSTKAGRQGLGYGTCLCQTLGVAVKVTDTRRLPGALVAQNRGYSPVLATSRCSAPPSRNADHVAKPSQGQGDQVVGRCGDDPCSCMSERNPSVAAGRGHGKPAHRSADAVPQSVSTTLHVPGRPLESTVNAEMSARFRHDFSTVRIHTDATANRSASDIGAQAYTVGRHVVFGANQYQPWTLPGRTLLVHELTGSDRQWGASRHPNRWRPPGR